MIVSILVPIYNRLEITKEGLTSLNNRLKFYKDNGQQKVTFHIIVIDDGSSDGSSDWIRDNFPETIVLIGNGNLWWSGAMNLGAEYAISNLKSDYILLWNDDVIGSNDYFLNLESIILEGKVQYKIIGSKIFYHGNQEKLLSTGGFFNKLTGKIALSKRPFKGGERWRECDWLSGMGTLIPHEVFTIQNIWWNHEMFPQYYGDTDFCLRCRAKGNIISISNNLILYNKIESSGIGYGVTWKELRLSLKSRRSNMNLKDTFNFYYQHGLPPFAFIGMAKTYVFYFLSFLLKRKKNARESNFG